MCVEVFVEVECADFALYDFKLAKLSYIVKKVHFHCSCISLHLFSCVRQDWGQSGKKSKVTVRTRFSQVVDRLIDSDLFIGSL